MLSDEVLRIDPAGVAADIAAWLRLQVLGTLNRRGVVVGISGGVDSAVVAALAARAVGPERVLGLLMPERDSSPDSLRLGQEVAGRFGLPFVEENIEEILGAAGCYARQAEAVRRVFPDYEDGGRFKLTFPQSGSGSGLNVPVLTIERQGGHLASARMPLEAYLCLLAATNFKQRTRAMVAYYHADRLRYAVAGTPNRLEYDQGFFVKGGDGLADVKPIAHLYKTQVYQLADHLGIPAAIVNRTPTTDTYPLPQTQEEFYFGLPYRQMDLCLYGYDRGLAPGEVAAATGLTADEIERVFADIARKRRASGYLHAHPILMEPVPEAGR
jgi:NAD+ synthase